MLGIIDWGIGGISIVKLIKEQMADVPVIYFSDTGATPYGKMTRPQLVVRLNDVIAYLKSRGMTHLVVGCNAASTAITFLADHGVPIDGMIETAVAEAVRQKPNRLGLIGGRRTVLSGVYRRQFADHNIAVRQRIAQPLSALIESGDISSLTLRAECKRIMSPLKNCSHVLLACTHYPAVLPVMSKYVSDETLFIDPVPTLVKSLRAQNTFVPGADLYLTTGEPKGMKRAAAAAFGWRMRNVQKITL